MFSKVGTSSLLSWLSFSHIASLPKLGFIREPIYKTWQHFSHNPGPFPGNMYIFLYICFSPPSCQCHLILIPALYSLYRHCWCCTWLAAQHYCHDSSNHIGVFSTTVNCALIDSAFSKQWLSKNPQMYIYTHTHTHIYIYIQREIQMCVFTSDECVVTTW